MSILTLLAIAYIATSLLATLTIYTACVAAGRVDELKEQQLWRLMQ